MQTSSIILLAMLLCTGCSEALADGPPSGFPSASRFGASMDTPAAVPHVTEREPVGAVREPKALGISRARGTDFVQCAQCR